MKLTIVVRRGWAGFIGGAVFGYTYLFTTPPVGTRGSDTALAVILVGIGIAFGVAVDVYLSRRRVFAEPIVVTEERRDTVSV